MSESCEKEYSLNEEVTRIEDLQFAGKDGLEKLHIPDSVKEIGNYAFMNCYALREIRMPERVVRIGAGLFQNCWQIRSIRIPEGTLSLGTDMFENCHALEELWLPLSLKEAARTSLSGCRNLKAIHISPEQIGILPPSARYTAALTYMEEHAMDPAADHKTERAMDPATDASDDTSPESAGAETIDHYVRERQKSFLDLAINRRSTEAVRYMLARGLIDETALREYLDRSVTSGRTEITALLLDSLKGREAGAGLDEDPFA